MKEDDGVTEVYSNMVASEKGSKGKSSMLKICTKIALEGRCLLQNLVNWLYMLWSYMRECRYKSKVETESMFFDGEQTEPWGKETYRQAMYSQS